MVRALDYKELKRFSVEDELAKLNIDEKVKDINIIGQKKATKALEFGLRVKADGYNIYIAGLPGTGKTTFAKAFAEKIAGQEPCAKDICYVYNFKDPQSPEYLEFDAGTGGEFKQDIDEFINQICIEIPKIFTDSDFEEQKNDIVKNYQDKRELVIKDITEEAKENGFGVKMTNSGMYFMPIVDGQIISEEDYNKLSDNLKEEISIKSEVIQLKALEIMHQINSFEKLTQEKVNELEYRVALFGLGRYINKLIEKYKGYDKALIYLSALKEDILENMASFLEDEEDEADTIQNILPWTNKKNKSDFLSKYRVNLFVDNSDKKGAPVVIDYNPSYANLVGEVEHDSEYGNFTTDYMKIKAGLLHKANGGYLILQMQDIISNYHIWEAIKKTIKTKKLRIESSREYSTGITVTSIKPEPIDIDVKIILVGDMYYYSLLHEFDDEFQKCFRIKAIFDYEMDYSINAVCDIYQFVKKYAKDNNLMKFDISAIAKIIEYSMRISENQDKLTTKFSVITEILIEANTWAKIDNKKIITAKYITKTIKEKADRLNIYEDMLGEVIDKNIVMINTEGEKIAQINGLAVLDTGDYVFGKPTKITATTYVGKAGIINIEKEAHMSGAIHDKGIEVLTGYLGQMYAQEFPLSLSCRVCFEQNYNGVDGDSASSTELYAILSSLADVPIRQDIAVTGSVSQRGEIQAIGGVTYKIEGFFELCKKRGLTGSQGVLIPHSNKSDLVLNDDVVNAVKERKFHIYAISTIDEGIELLTGIEAGKKDRDGKYPQDTIHGRVMKKLKEFYNATI